MVNTITKCWDSKLSSNNYDVIFCSHMLEHIPQFRLEKQFMNLIEF